MEIKYKPLLFLFALPIAFLFSSCKKDQTTSTSVADWPVVISYITPGQPISVKVYQQKDITDTATYGSLITGLSLTITDGSKSISLTETSTGTYTYSPLNYLTTGKTYTLKFTYNNVLVSASTLMPAKPTNFVASRDSINLPLALSNLSTSAVALTYTWDNPDSLYHMLVFKNDDNNAFKLRAQRNSQLNFSFNAAKATYYQVDYQSLNYLGVYHIMLYSVNKEYIDLLTSNANSTSQQLTNPPTNVTNGYGIFTAVQADTLRLALTQY